MTDANPTTLEIAAIIDHAAFDHRQIARREQHDCAKEAGDKRRHIALAKAERILQLMEGTNYAR